MIENFLGQDVPSTLLRLNILTRNGYYIEYVEDTLAVVWLNHYFRRDLDLILYEDGMIVDRTVNPVGEEDKIRIYEEEHEKFLIFVKDLPKTSFFHKIFSFFIRGGM